MLGVELKNAMVKAYRGDHPYHVEKGPADRKEAEGFRSKKSRHRDLRSQQKAQAQKTPADSESRAEPKARGITQSFDLTKNSFARLRLS